MAQQIIGDFPVLIFTGQQRIRRTDHASFRKHLPVGKFASRLHSCQRQESRPAEPVLLQETDQLLRGILILSDHVLDPAAEGGLDGCLIFSFGMEEIGDNAADAGHSLALLHDSLDAVPVALISFGDIQQRVMSCLCFLKMLPQRGKLLFLFGSLRSSLRYGLFRVLYGTLDGFLFFAQLFSGSPFFLDQAV